MVDSFRSDVDRHLVRYIGAGAMEFTSEDALEGVSAVSGLGRLSCDW